MRTSFRRNTVLMLCLAFVTTGAAWAGSIKSVWIDAERHPLDDSLRAVLMLPEGDSAEHPVPGCLVVHGSGGLFKENAPGEDCGPDLENNFRELGELLVGQGVAALLPSSFVSRDPRFCEDNDDAYFQFVAPPFHNEGDGDIARDAYYKMRRTVIRPLDLLAAADYLCERQEVDCQRICMVGTSNGATSIMTYVANDLQRHMTEYTDTEVRRVHESQSNFVDRQTAFANFPVLPPTLPDRLASRVLPRFAQAISAGCDLRKLVPTVAPDAPSFDPVQHLNDLYYPAAGVEFHLDIGTLDDVPEQCYNGGIRELQAAAYEMLTMATHSRYLVETYEGAGHNLLGERGEELHAKLSHLVRIHFFSSIFKDGFEVSQD
ncbi:MAG TPA: hypothetical protein PKZ76_12115 [Xanthomonadaceae bacterium]|nr:hypothetical protein [Xanthomonadaceae bacterium]